MSNFNLIDFYHLLEILLITNEEELEQFKVRYFSKLKTLFPNFTVDLVETSSHDPEQVIFEFLSHDFSCNNKDNLPKELSQFAEETATIIAYESDNQYILNLFTN